MDNHFKDIPEENINIAPKVRIISAPCEKVNNTILNNQYKKKILPKNDICKVLNTKTNNINNVLKENNCNMFFDNNCSNENQYDVPTNIYKPEILPKKAQLFDKTVNYDLEEAKNYSSRNERINIDKNQINKKKPRIDINSILSEVTKKKNLPKHNSRNVYIKSQANSRLLTTNNSKKKISVGNDVFPMNKTINNIKTNKLKKTKNNTIDIYNPIFKILCTKTQTIKSNRNSKNNSINLKRRLFENSVSKDSNIISKGKLFIILNSPCRKKIKSNENTNKKNQHKYKTIIYNPIFQKIDNKKDKINLNSERKKLKSARIINQVTKPNTIRNNSGAKKNRNLKIQLDLTKIKKPFLFDS